MNSTFLMGRLSHELALALKAVTQASILTQRIFKTTGIAIATKTDSSPVTGTCVKITIVADLAAQCCVNSIINRAFPSDPIVAEEDAAELDNELIRDAVHSLVNTWEPLNHAEIRRTINLGNHPGGNQGRFWTLDPIDGFLRGGQYAICLALINEGQVDLAVLCCPNLPLNPNDLEGPRGSLFYSVRGQGAFQKLIGSQDSHLIKVSEIQEAKNSAILSSVEKGHSSSSDLVNISTILNNPINIKMDSQCKYAIVARGEAGMYIRIPKNAEYEEKIWDHASGALIVAEAGGKVTDINGKDLDFGKGRTLKFNSGILCTSLNLYDQVLDVVKSVVRKYDVIL